MLNKICSIKNYSVEEIKNEVMVFQSDLKTTMSKNNPITKDIILTLMEQGFDVPANIVVDTRVHMLKPGWFPSIPGWHCDSVPRDPETKEVIWSDDLSGIKHYLCVVDFNTGSMTEFLEESYKTQKNIPEGKTFWGYQSETIRGLNLKSFPIQSNTIYQFDANDYHTSIPATGHGFRFFFRASILPTPRHRNEVRQQVQTYLPFEDLGW